MNRTLRIISFLFFVLTVSFPLFAGEDLPPGLGSGDPTLHIIYKTKNQYVIYLNEPWVVKDIDMHSGGYAIDPVQRGYTKRQIILRSTESPLEGDPAVLYPFDEQMAFTCPYGGSGWNSDGKTYNYWPRKTQVFSTNGDDILISEDVYALARSRYGLATNQLFLGKIGTNIFYWETRDPTKVYYHTAEGNQAANYFKIQKGVIDIMGITKAVSKNKDVGIWVGRKSPHWAIYRLLYFIAPYEDAVFEESFKDAKQVKSNQ